MGMSHHEDTTIIITTTTAINILVMDTLRPRIAPFPAQRCSAKTAEALQAVGEVVELPVTTSFVRQRNEHRRPAATSRGVGGIICGKEAARAGTRCDWMGPLRPGEAGIRLHLTSNPRTNFIHLRRRRRRTVPDTEGTVARIARVRAYETARCVAGVRAW